MYRSGALGWSEKEPIEQEGLTNSTGMELLDGVKKLRIDREGVKQILV